MKKYISVFIILLAMASPSFAAIAFNDMDTDKDGFINPEEAQMHYLLGSRFTELDIDEDDMINTEEFKVYLQGASE